MVTQTAVDPAQMVAQVEPVLRQYADKAERERRMAPEAVVALKAAGFFRLWTPQAYGGLEIDPAAGNDIFERLAYIDSATGWVVALCSGVAATTQALSAKGTEEMFFHPDVIVAGAANPPGTAVPVAGGYRISGQWPFGSACTFADWIQGLCLVMDGEAPKLDEQGNPTVVIGFMRASELEVLDTWDTLGMRGTGSHDYRATDVFVPEHRSYVLGGLWDKPSPAFDTPLYRLGIFVALPSLPMVALGAARAALDEVIGLATTKTPSFLQTGLADKPVAQDHIARARALIEAGRAAVDTATEQRWQRALAGERTSGDDGISIALACSFGMEAAAAAVDHIHTAAGTSAIRNGQRFQRHFRDVHTLTQHAFSSTARYESLGRMMLGRPSDFGFYYV